MDIIGKITGIKYQVLFTEDLKEVKVNNFDINQMPSCCLLTSNNHTFAISKWVSPKRTRSYPFERVYNTLNISKKITVIPIVKDEGAIGDRDFIQWDTVSLMSLLDVFVIFGYYHNAEKADKKITNQQFDNKYVLSKIREIQQYHSSALHWNLNELNTNLHKIIDKVKLTSYKLKGAISSICSKKDIAQFFSENNFTALQTKLVETIFLEAKQNHFIIQIQYAK